MSVVTWIDWCDWMEWWWESCKTVEWLTSLIPPTRAVWTCGSVEVLWENDSFSISTVAYPSSAAIAHYVNSLTSTPARTLHDQKRLREGETYFYHVSWSFPLKLNEFIKATGRAISSKKKKKFHRQLTINRFPCTSSCPRKPFIMLTFIIYLGSIKITRHTFTIWISTTIYPFIPPIIICIHFHCKVVVVAIIFPRIPPP